MKAKCDGSSRARFIAHRGESADAPENTMAAFKLAVERNVDGIECDVRLTADNEIVCMHDATTTRTAGVELVVAESTFAELRKLDAGSWKSADFADERIPTLAELLSLARDGMEIYVEVKCGVEIIPRLREVFAESPQATPGRVLFICFKTDVMSALREHFPDYRTYWLSSLRADESGVPLVPAFDFVSVAKSCGADGVDVRVLPGMSERYLRTVKSAGLSLHVWTVDDVAEARRVIEMGAETITSNKAAYLADCLLG